MANRREVLQGGIAALALPMAAGAAFAPASRAAAAAMPALPLYMAIFDTRYPESRAFAAQMKSAGVAVQGMQGDVTPIWYRDLDVRWRKGPVAIAGLTEHGPLFCLERLAWEKGMRVIYRGDHAYRDNGCIEHALSGPAPLLEQALKHAPGDWGGAFGTLAAQCPAMPAGLSKMVFTMPAARPEGSGREPLISWIIAPAAST